MGSVEGTGADFATGAAPAAGFAEFEAGDFVLVAGATVEAVAAFDPSAEPFAGFTAGVVLATAELAGDAVPFGGFGVAEPATTGVFTGVVAFVAPPVAE